MYDLLVYSRRHSVTLAVPVLNYDTKCYDFASLPTSPICQPHGFYNLTVPSQLEVNEQLDRVKNRKRSLQMHIEEAGEDTMTRDEESSTDSPSDSPSDSQSDVEDSTAM